MKALFRFNIIFPLLDAGLTPGERAGMIRGICAKEYRIPYSTKRSMSPSTVSKWYKDYQAQGTIDSLAPKGRSDKGKKRSLTPDAEKEIIRRYRECGGSIPMNKIVEKAGADGVLGP